MTLSVEVLSLQVYTSESDPMRGNKKTKLIILHCRPLNMHDLTSPREGSRSYHVSVVDFAGLVKPPQDQADDGMTGVKETKSHSEQAGTWVNVLDLHGLIHMDTAHLVVASLTSILPSIYRAKQNMSNDEITALP